MKLSLTYIMERRLGLNAMLGYTTEIYSNGYVGGPFCVSNHRKTLVISDAVLSDSTPPQIARTPRNVRDHDFQIGKK
jgi:hypothetical protein